MRGETNAKREYPPCVLVEPWPRPVAEMRAAVQTLLPWWSMVPADVRHLHARESWRAELQPFLDGTGWLADCSGVDAKNGTPFIEFIQEKTGKRKSSVNFPLHLFPTARDRKAEILRVLSS